MMQQASAILWEYSNNWNKLYHPPKKKNSSWTSHASEREAQTRLKGAIEQASK